MFLNGKASHAVERLPMSRWPETPLPFEPVYSWFRRAAACNYAFSTDGFFGSLGLNSKNWDYDELLGIAALLPIQGYDALSWSTPRRIGSAYEMCGQQVPLRFFAKKGQRVCPMCLEDEPYSRVWFDFTPVASCPVHNVELVDGLENDPIDWRRPEIGWTRAGIKLGKEHSIDREASELDRYAVQVLTGLRPMLPDHLFGRSLIENIEMAICVAKVFEGGAALSITHTEARNLAQMGFPAVWQGKEPVITFLQGAEWLQPQSDKGRYLDRCNYASTTIRNLSSRDSRSFVTECFAKARVRNGCASPQGRLARFADQRENTTLKSVAADLELHPATLTKLLKELDINERHPKFSRVHRLGSKDIAKLKSYVAPSLSEAEVAHALGCEIRDVIELVNRGLLRTHFSRRGRRYFNKDALSAFEADMLPVSNNERGSMGQAIESFVAATGLSLGAVCAHIIRNGKITVVQHDSSAPLFRGLKVSWKEGYYREVASGGKLCRPIRPSAQTRDAITFAEATARIGTSSTGFKKLIRASYIKTVEDKRGKQSVCEKSLDNFEHAYAKASAYCAVSIGVQSGPPIGAQKGPPC